jgi:hypothetical protein
VDFLEVVSEVRFNYAAYRYGGYTWKARSLQGDVIQGPWTATGTGGREPREFRHFSVLVPDGYYLTQLQFSNGDPISFDGAFWIDDIQFTVHPPATGDLNADGVKDRADLDLLLTQIRQHSTDNRYDLNGDGQVDIADARYLVLHFSDP